MTIIEPKTHHAGRPGHPALAGGPIYLDYNATTPVDPRVADTITAALADEFGKPSSSYSYGRSAQAALDQARAQLAALINAPADSRIVFTGSGSEANTLALHGTVYPNQPQGQWVGQRPHIITQATEHPAVLTTARRLHARGGARITVLPVDSVGLINLDQLAAAISDATVLVSIMAANTETGTLHPLPGRTHLNGHPRCRLPNTLNVSINHNRALTVLDQLAAATVDPVAASAGSACHSGRDQLAATLTAMSIPTAQALQAIRLSIGRWTTEQEIEHAAQQIAIAANNH